MEPHACPRKIKIQPPMILGLSAAQSFFWVSSGFVLGLLTIIFERFGIGSTIMAWLTLFGIMIIELIVMKVINFQRRALIYHCFLYLKLIRSSPGRFSGRGDYGAWTGSKTIVVGGERD